MICKDDYGSWLIRATILSRVGGKKSNGDFGRFMVESIPLRSLEGPMKRWAVLAAALLAVPVIRNSHRARPPTGAERISPNDNRKSAGTLSGGVLTIRLEARAGEWHAKRR